MIFLSGAFECGTHRYQGLCCVEERHPWPEVEIQKEGYSMGDLELELCTQILGYLECSRWTRQEGTSSLWQSDSSRILTWSYHVHLGFALGGEAPGAPTGAL